MLRIFNAFEKKHPLQASAFFLHYILYFIFCKVWYNWNVHGRRSLAFFSWRCTIFITWVHVWWNRRFRELL